MTESNSIEPNDPKVAQQMQLDRETTKSAQPITSKDDNNIRKSLENHPSHHHKKRESEDENLTGDSNNNETTDTCCLKTDEYCTDVECEVRSSVNECPEEKSNLVSETTVPVISTQLVNRYDDVGNHQNGRNSNQRLHYANVEFHMNQFQPPEHYYARPQPVQPLATTYYNQAAQNQATFYTPVCIGLNQSGTPVLPIRLPPCNQPLPLLANDWLYTQCESFEHYPHRFAHAAQVFDSNNSHRNDFVAALYTAPWVQSEAPLFQQPVPQPVVPAIPLTAQVDNGTAKSHRYRTDVPSNLAGQAEQIDSRAHSNGETVGDKNVVVPSDGAAHERAVIENDDCQDDECIECECNKSNDATADHTDSEQVDDNVKTHASDITIGPDNVNKTADRLSTSDDDLNHRSGGRYCNVAIEDVDKNHARRQQQRPTSIDGSGDSIDAVVVEARLAEVITTKSCDDQETSESGRLTEQETKAEHLVESADSIVDKEEEPEVSANQSVASSVHPEEPHQPQQHNQLDTSVITTDVLPKSYQSPSPAANGQQKSSMTKNISPTNDASETTPKPQQQDSGPLAAAATDDISSDPKVTKDNPSISLRQQTNNQIPSAQPVLHHYQCIRQYVTPTNCYVTSNSETNKFSTDHWQPLVDTCQLSAATHLLPRQYQNNIRQQQSLYNHNSSQFDQQLLQPPLVYQPPYTSSYFGLIPIFNNKQPLIYAYQYGPYYGLIQQQCRPTTNHYHYQHQQSTQCYSTPPLTQIPRSHISNGAHIQPVPVDPTVITYNHQPLYWQPHPIPVPFNDQLNCFRQFQPLVAPNNGTRLNISLTSLLPVDAEPARVRQAYGMDKVWLDEFEALFAQFMSSNMLWTLIEVEANPSIRRDADIIGYKGRYIVRVNNGLNRYGYQNADATRAVDHQLSDFNIDSKSIGNTISDDITDEEDGHADLEGRPKRADSRTPTTDNQSDHEIGDKDEDYSTCEAPTCTDVSGKVIKQEMILGLNDEGETERDQQIVLDINEIYDKSNGVGNYDNSSSRQSESDCDSGAVMANSATTTTSGGEESVSEESQRKLPAEIDSPVREHTNMKCSSNATDRKHSRRFRMFIDSAKVRFCCDICGHGWTSMKGRVVFWYELFELVYDDTTPVEVIGYCAYKLFGQQCDVCQVEGRFERPMWYPEEVTKALNNLCNKIGQVYFGFKMPAIDKQRRADIKLLPNLIRGAALQKRKPVTTDDSTNSSAFRRVPIQVPLVAQSEFRWQYYNKYW